MIASDFVAKLGGRMRTKSTGIVNCPAHKGETPGLSVSDGPNGRVLVHCFAGCSQAAVIAELRKLKLWPDYGNGAPELTEAEREEQRQRDRERKEERARRNAFVTKSWQDAWVASVPL